MVGTPSRDGRPPRRNACDILVKRFALFLFLGPLLPLPAVAFTSSASPNAYMVENTSGTSPSGAVCYDFKTQPGCSAFIAGISSGSISPGSTNYIQNTATPTTATQIFNVSSGSVSGLLTVSSAQVTTAIVLGGTAGTSGQSIQSNGSTAPSWVNVPAAILATTSVWTAGQTFNSSITVNGAMAANGSGGTTGQTLQSNGSTAPTWVNVPAAILATTSTWTAGQTFSSATITAETVGVLTSSQNVALINQCGYITGSIDQTAQLAISTSVTTTGTVYTSTGPQKAITPKCVSDVIKATALGAFQNNSVSGNNSFASIFRANTDLSNGSGFCQIEGSITGSDLSPCTMIFLDSPASVSSTIYSIRIKSSSVGITTSFGAAAGTTVILLEEIAQ